MLGAYTIDAEIVKERLKNTQTEIEPDSSSHLEISLLCPESNGNRTGRKDSVFIRYLRPEGTGL